MDNIFLQVSILLGIIVSVAFVVRLFKQPLMIAYIVAGIIAGPLFLNLINGKNELFDAFAEFGVVLLLFVVGMSLSLDHIKKIGKVAGIVGGGQILFTGLLGFGLTQLLGFSTISALYLSIAIIFSSTIIIVKLLAEKKDAQTVYGKHVLGLMVVQDIAALFVMIFITTFAESSTSISATLIELLFKVLVLSAIVYFLSRFVLPKILDRVAHSGEFLFIFTIAWCFGLASLLYYAGFPIEIGALVSGLSLGSSPYQSQISSRIKPLRDFFIVIFFVILGSEMGAHDLGGSIGASIALAALVLFGNAFILYTLFRRLKFTRRNSFLAGVTATHVSEFGFVLLFTGAHVGHIAGAEISVFTVVALITMFLSSYAITYNEQLYKFFMPFFNLFGKDRYQQQEKEKHAYSAWLFGYHRIGWSVAEKLSEKKIDFAVVDFDPETIARLHRKGIPAFFGDAADVEFLENLGLEKSKLIVSTLPAADDQITLVRHVRAAGGKARIITNVYDSSELDSLYKAGADFVMMPHLLGGKRIAEILEDTPWKKKVFDDLKKQQKHEMKSRFAEHAH